MPVPSTALVSAVRLTVVVSVSSVRLEERGVGVESCTSCRSRWSPDHQKKKEPLAAVVVRLAGHAEDHALDRERREALAGLAFAFEPNSFIGQCAGFEADLVHAREFAGEHGADAAVRVVNIDFDARLRDLRAIGLRLQ